MSLWKVIQSITMVRGVSGLASGLIILLLRILMWKGEKKSSPYNWSFHAISKYNSFHGILFRRETDTPDYPKLNIWRVTKILTSGYKSPRLTAASDVLNCFYRKGENFSHVYKMWVSYIDAESKQQSVQWHHSSLLKQDWYIWI